MRNHLRSLGMIARGYPRLGEPSQRGYLAILPERPTLESPSMETFSDERVLLIEIGQPDVADPAAMAQNGDATDVAARQPHKVTAEQVMRLISGRNVELLQMIKLRRPQSLAELSRISGRPTASLTRTLQRLSALGIVVMRRSKGREKIPTVACDCLRFELPLVSAVVPESQSGLKAK